MERKKFIVWESWTARFRNVNVKWYIRKCAIVKIIIFENKLLMMMIFCNPLGLFYAQSACSYQRRDWRGYSSGSAAPTSWVGDKFEFAASARAAWLDFICLANQTGVLTARGHDSVVDTVLSLLFSCSSPIPDCRFRGTNTGCVVCVRANYPLSAP